MVGAKFYNICCTVLKKWLYVLQLKTILLTELAAIISRDLATMHAHPPISDAGDQIAEWAGDIFAATLQPQNSNNN